MYCNILNRASSVIVNANASELNVHTIFKIQLLQKTNSLKSQNYERKKIVFSLTKINYHKFLYGSVHDTVICHVFKVHISDFVSRIFILWSNGVFVKSRTEEKRRKTRKIRATTKIKLTNGIRRMFACATTKLLNQKQYLSETQT